MRLTVIEHYETLPGKLWAYEPTGRTREAALAAEVSSARPSIAQEAHIRTAADRRSKELEWSPWLALCFRVPRKLDLDALGRAMTAYVQRHRTLHTWFDIDPAAAGSPESPSDELTRRLITTPEELDFTWVHRATPTTADATVDALYDRFRAETSPLTWPSFAFGAIDHGDPATGGEGFTVHYAVDHSHSDALSMAFVLYELVEMYTCAAEDPTLSGSALTAAAGLPPVGDYIAYGESERAAGETISLEDPAIPVWLAAWEASGGVMPRFVLPLGLEPGQTARSARDMRLVADAETMAAFDRVTRASGGGMTAGLFALLAEADRRLGRTDTYLALNTIGTRFEEEHWFAQGWFVNLVPIVFPLTPESTFSSLVPLAQQSVQTSKQAMRTPVRAILELMGQMTGTGVEQTQVPPIVSYLDKRKVPGGEHPGALDKFGVVGPGNTGDLSAWCNRGSEGMYVAVSFPETPVARESVARYLDTITGVLDEIAAQAADLPVTEAVS